MPFLKYHLRHYERKFPHLRRCAWQQRREYIWNVFQLLGKGETDMSYGPAWIPDTRLSDQVETRAEMYKIPYERKM